MSQEGRGAYDAAGVTVVSRYDMQSSNPGRWVARMARRQLSALHTCAEAEPARRATRLATVRDFISRASGRLW